MALVLYGIPTCGTVKKARKWLEDRGVVYRFVDFRQTPPDRASVGRWVKALGAGPMRNTSGKAYRQLPTDKASWSDEVWADRFAEDPMLIKRPVVERDGEPVRVGWRGSDEDLWKAVGA